MKNKPLILIVDDDADDREILRDAFLTINRDLDCVQLENGDHLMSYLQSSVQHTSPALIMLDLNMPGKDGRESLREIKSDQQFLKIPTIVFTTSSSHHDKMMAYELGANCFITKPDTFDKLTNMASYICKLWLG